LGIFGIRGHLRSNHEHRRTLTQVGIHVSDMELTQVGIHVSDMELTQVGIHVSDMELTQAGTQSGIHPRQEGYAKWVSCFYFQVQRDQLSLRPRRHPHRRHQHQQRGQPAHHLQDHW
jgi:hypothetical protein